MCALGRRGGLGRGTRKALGPAASFSCRPAPAAGNKGAAGLGRADQHCFPPPAETTVHGSAGAAAFRRAPRAPRGGGRVGGEPRVGPEGRPSAGRPEGSLPMS